MHTMVVATVLNASDTVDGATALLAHHLHTFSDVDVIAGQKHYPAHRAVLAVHSLDFREAFSSSPLPDASHHLDLHVDPIPLPSQSQPSSSAPTHQPPAPPPASPPHRYRVHIALEDVDDHIVRAGWQLIYSYCYGAQVVLDTETVLAALPICRRYRFDELASVLDAFLCEGAVTPANCTRVFAAASLKTSTFVAPPKRRPSRDADAELVQSAAWHVMKESFESITDWAPVPYAAMVRLLKLNDIAVSTEASVFNAVVSWLNANSHSVDDDVAASLVKLVRFPTMTLPELEAASDSELVSLYPVCRKYIARGLAARSDEKRGLIRSVIMESSPVYRRRRTDALTFSDRVTSWSRVGKSVHTSSRYFAGCLWNLIIETESEWLGVHLGCLSETDEKEVDVELDFSLFVVRHTGSSLPELVSKEVKGACFGRSGQRIGFSKLMRRSEIEAEGARYLIRDTLFVGASIRLRCSNALVVGISEDGDDTAESESTMTLGV